MRMDVWELKKWLDPEGFYEKEMVRELVESSTFKDRNVRLNGAKCLKCGHLARGEHMTFFKGSEGKCTLCGCKKMEVEVWDFELDIEEIRRGVLNAGS